LNKHCKVPLPETVKLAIEDTFGKKQTIKGNGHDFLLQAMDLIYYPEIWGNESKNIGTVGMEEPFNPFKHGHCDGKVDEVVDGVWCKETVHECAKIAKGEIGSWIDLLLQ